MFSTTGTREVGAGQPGGLGAKTRQGKNTFLLAKSYLIEGDYPMAASYTTAAIESMHGSISSRHLVSMNYLYQSLLHSPYGTNSDVGELGVKLLKMQKPELFQ